MSLADTLFSPLGKEYCAWFYFWMVAMFIIFLLSFVAQVVLLLKGKLKIWTLITGSFGPLLAYFTARLYYSMCIS